MFLHACFTMRMFTTIRIVIVPPRSKIVYCLTYILFVVLLTNKEKDQACVNTTKLVIYSISFSGKSTSKGVRPINIYIYLAMYTVTFIRSY